jgi:hypothetical protein
VADDLPGLAVDLRRRREAFALATHVVCEPVIDAFAPIVSRLTGT